jgi:membrane protein implicated in regulation of membrane protease activity
MKFLKGCVRELWGLFVDDGGLALAIILWVALAALLAGLFPEESKWRALALFAGLAAILMGNVRRTVQKKRGKRMGPSQREGQSSHSSSKIWTFLPRL